MNFGMEPEQKRLALFAEHWKKFLYLCLYRAKGEDKYPLDDSWDVPGLRSNIGKVIFES